MSSDPSMSLTTNISSFLPSMPQPDLIPRLPPDLALDCLLRTPLRSHSLLKQVCRSWNALLSSPSFYQTRLRSGYAAQCGCLIQALQQPAPPTPGKTPVYGVSVYDARLRSWDRLPPIPDLPDGLPLFCQCVPVAESLVLLGGWNPVSWAVLKCVYVYDFSRGQWRRGADMPSARSFFACGSVGSRVVVAGGHDDSKNALRSAEMYDFDRDIWEPLPDMIQDRDECRGAVVGGDFLVISGFCTESQGQFVSSAERFDFSTRCWEKIEDVWPPLRPPSSIVSMQGQLYALQETKLVRFKWKESQWVSVGEMPENIRVAPCLTVVGDGILVSGCRGGMQPHEIFLYKPCGRENGRGEWQRVAAAEEFAGLVQAGCYVIV